MADRSGLEAAIDRLFAAPLKDFVATRKALAKERKAAGDVAGAAAIEARKKPAPTAWALDWVAREHADATAAFLEAAARVREAQRGALQRGDMLGLGEARATLATAEARVMELAREGMAGAGASWTPDAQRRIATTLKAMPMAADEDRARFAAGRLEVDLEIDDPFGAMVGFVGERGPAERAGGKADDAARAAERVREQERERERAQAEAEAKAEERRRRVARAEELEAKARELEALAREARLAAQRARAEVDS